MKSKIQNFLAILCVFVPLLMNVSRASAAPLNDPPTPSPLYEGEIMGTPCKSYQTPVGVMIGADAPVFTCISKLPVTDALQVPYLTISGADPKFGLTGVPLAYGYKYQPVQSMGKRMDGLNKNRVCFNGGYSQLECYNDYYLWVVVVAGNVSQPDQEPGNIRANGSTCYGTTCVETTDKKIAILKTYGFQNGTYWDMGVKMAVEAWRQGSFSTLAGATPGTGRPVSYLEGVFGVDSKGIGMNSVETFPGSGGLPWIRGQFAANNFTGVMSMTTSKEGSTSTPAGEPAFSVKFKQTWTVFVKQGWKSVDRRLEWTERVCNPDPTSTIWNPKPDICNDEDKSKWYNNIGSQNYNSEWLKVYSYDRYQIMDKTTGGASGFTDHIAIPYYQTQPLLTDR